MVVPPGELLLSSLLGARRPGRTWTHEDKLAHAPSVPPVCAAGHQLTLIPLTRPAQQGSFRLVPFPCFLGVERLASVLPWGCQSTSAPAVTSFPPPPQPRPMLSVSTSDTAWADPSGVQMPSTPAWSPIPLPRPPPCSPRHLHPPRLCSPYPRGGAQLLVPHIPAPSLADSPASPSPGAPSAAPPALPSVLLPEVS